MRKIVFAWYGPCGRGEGKEQRKTAGRRLGNGHACVYKLFLFPLNLSWQRRCLIANPPLFLICLFIITNTGIFSILYIIPAAFSPSPVFSLHFPFCFFFFLSCVSEPGQGQGLGLARFFLQEKV